MRYQFIEDHRTDYPVTLLCRVMQVVRSGYYVWRNQPLSTRKMADLVLLMHIRDIFEEGRQTYGSERIQGIRIVRGRRQGGFKMAERLFIAVEALEDETKIAMLC